MHILPAVLFSSMALAYETNRAGSLYISMIGDEPVHLDLRIYGNKLYISDQKTRFDYDVRGIVWVAKTSNYLSVSPKGKLKTRHWPETGFLLNNRDGSLHHRSLSYYGMDEFELCEDYLIGLRSNCPGALKVKITFRDRFHSSFK